jgi:hypothetical protein
LDEPADVQRGGQSLGAADPGVDLGRGIGQLDDMRVLAVLAFLRA